MKLHRGEIISLGIVIMSFIIGIFLYPQLPNEIASHWNAQGQVDGYMSKFWGVFLMPFILLAMWGIFLAIPNIDPKKENIEKFRESFDNFIVVIMAFMFYVYGIILSWNLGYQFDFARFIVPGFAVLLYAIGAMLAHAHPNWTIGIRTPWTMSSQKVWDETHRLGSMLFKVLAFVVLVGMVFPSVALWLLLVPLFAVVLFLIVFSYVRYQKVKQ